MRKLILFTLVLVLSITSSYSQKKVVVDDKGNYTLVQSAAKKVADVDTGKFFIDKTGQKYPILKSVNNKLYYWKTSKVETCTRFTSLFPSSY